MERTKEPGYQTVRNAIIMVTGSSGMIGGRMVEMVIERGARKVVCFDIAPPSSIMKARFHNAIQESENKSCELQIFSGDVEGNLTKPQSVVKACDGVDVVFHIGAILGPAFRPEQRGLFRAVNTQGTINVIEACKCQKRPPILIFSSTPLTGLDPVTGCREEDLNRPSRNDGGNLYCETKLAAEDAVCQSGLRAIRVGHPQVYGPYDVNFFPKILNDAYEGTLFYGGNDITVSVVYVDNFCHGLMCAADAAHHDSPVLNKFYVISDDHNVSYWKWINDVVTYMGFEDLFLRKVEENRCINPDKLANEANLYNAKLLKVDKYYSIDNAKHDLLYNPICTHDKAWIKTKIWFKQNWLQNFLKNHTD